MEHLDKKVATRKMNVEDWLAESKYEINFRPLVSAYQRMAQRIGQENEIESVSVYVKKGDRLKLACVNEMEEVKSFSYEWINHLVKVDSEVEPFSLVHEAILTDQVKWNVCVPLSKKDQRYGFIIHTFNLKEQANSFAASLLPNDAMQSLLAEAHEREKVEGIWLKRNILMQVTKKCHSSMDIGEVLKQIITALEQVFPSWSVQLYLSHEWEVDSDLSIKPLMYGIDNENRIAEHAYLKGELQIERGEHELQLFAPLRGKQAVYGVIEMGSPQVDRTLQKHDIEFINMLADTGGNALENAELYQQSRNLNQDLQLINQTSHQLNTHLRLKDTISYMTKQIVVSFGAEQVGFFLFEEDGGIKVLKGSTPVFEDSSFLDTLDRVFIEIKNQREPQFIGDSLNHAFYSHIRFRTLLAVPMIQSGDLIGVVIVLHPKAYRFSYDHFKLLQSLVHHSTLAFTNAMLHEKLEKLVITDHLTDLYSRNYLDQKINESIKTDAFGAYLLFDIDNFKLVNDSYGHQIGDEIIVQVADIMKQNIREEDIAARWGGEELAVYLPRVDVSIAKKIATRIVEVVAEKTTPYVTISCGVSYWHHSNEAMTIMELVKDADDGLYAAKRAGKNQVYVQQEENKQKEEA